MKPSFPPPAREARSAPAREALFVMAVALVCGAACTPNQNVKPGAPELIEFTIAQPAPPGGFPPFMATTVKADTPVCVDQIKDGDACLPMGKKADVADGGTVTMDIPADGLCRDTANMNWCTCVAGMDPKVGTWSCAEFTNVMAVIAVFDRLLDTTPFDMADAGPLTDIVTTTASSGAPAVDLLTDYSSTGAGNGLVFNEFGPFFGNLRGDGPSLVSAPQPEFPSGATVTVTLDGNKVRAKDGTTPFTGTGLLASGLLVFKMAPFSASVTPPADAAMDPSVTVAFTNFAEPAPCPAMDPMDPKKTIACVTEPHITATSNGAPIAVAVESGGGAYVTVKPSADSWPAGATIVVTVDATTKNLLGQMIDAAASGMFTAP